MKRFWNKVACAAPDECWPWLGGISKGYGSFKIDGVQHRANRVAFFLKHGTWPVDNALHTCDFKLCCNPAHLYDGTKKQNAEDAVTRGLHPQGEHHGRAKLTETDVLEMRELRRVYKTPYTKLGKNYGVSDVVARKACLGLSWDHVS